MIDNKELEIARLCLAKALEKGAQKARVTLTLSTMDLVSTLNGEVDKVTHCLDRSLCVNLFVDGRYGAYATNRLVPEELDPFLERAVATTRMLAADKFRDLPDPSRTAKDAKDGLELDLYDPTYLEMNPQKRIHLALDASVFKKSAGEGWTFISEEGEYSDSVTDTYVIDSQGLECRQIETSFEYGVEMTILGDDGERYSGYWWDASPWLKTMKMEECCPIALKQAVDQIHPKRHRSGKFNLVIGNDVASKVVSPVLHALSAYSIQQKNSFLADSLGKRMFPEGLTIMDDCHRPGEGGSRLFDSEGVATVECPIIENGVVKEYFVNTYMSGKMGIPATAEEASRPHIMPFPKPGLGLEDILRMCGDGIYVTEFNGGNNNSSTGNFSYGIEGFAFKNGKITHPVHEMLITGNFLDLWGHLIAAGDDPRICAQKLVPTLAFSDVNFSA